MSGDLDAFLKSGTPPEASPPTSTDGGTAAPASGTGDVKPDPGKPDPGQAANKNAAPAKPAATPDPDDDAEPGDPVPGQPIVPRTAYEKERARRQNWVERASRAEAERDALAKQLEDAKKGPPPPPPQPLPPIDPATDPEGYTRRMRGVVLNERLNTSEMMALDKHGKEVIDRETEYFKKRGEAEPRLWAELYSQPHPYQWMIDNNATARLHEEIGTDPAAYEQKLRAKWEQEKGADPPVSPVAGMPPSLANARSSAPRGMNGFSGPMSMYDILKRPERKR
jgi:hypothetical protein